MTKILGIESTCDEVGIAVVENGRMILSNVIASSADIHKEYGGVFPELASRKALEMIIPTIKESLQKGRIDPKDLSGIAVANGPGLMGSLLVGLQVAKALSITWDLPLIGVNHVEAHLYAAMMSNETAPTFPALGVVLSGGHTMLLKINGIGDYELISQTVDDAIGEAFDKVATMIGIPYPGGASLEKLAERGDPSRFPFKGGRVKEDPLAFSFSGLKTACLLASESLQEKDHSDFAASFQRAAINDVVKKAKIAAEKHNLSHLYFGGGVVNNNALKKSFQETLMGCSLHFPKKELTSDNGAMIAGLGFHKLLKNPLGDGLDLEAKTRILIA